MSTTQSSPLHFLSDLPITLSARFEGTKRDIRDILSVSVGTVLLLENKIDVPVGLYANGKPVGRGEIVVTEGKIGVQIAELMPVESSSSDSNE